MAEQDWKAIEAQAQTDLEAIETDQDAVAFIQKYFAKDLQPDYLFTLMNTLPTYPKNVNQHLAQGTLK